MVEYIEALEEEFYKYKNNTIAIQQAAYMKNQFEFLGLKTIERRMVCRPFLSKSALPSKEELPAIVAALWKKPEREFQYFGQELVFKYQDRFELSDIVLFQEMMSTKSW